MQSDAINLRSSRIVFSSLSVTLFSCRLHLSRLKYRESERNLEKKKMVCRICNASQVKSSLFLEHSERCSKLSSFKDELMKLNDIILNECSKAKELKRTVGYDLLRTRQQTKDTCGELRDHRRKSSPKKLQDPTGEKIFDPKGKWEALKIRLRSDRRSSTIDLTNFGSQQSGVVDSNSFSNAMSKAGTRLSSRAIHTETATRPSRFKLNHEKTHPEDKSSESGGLQIYESILIEDPDTSNQKEASESPTNFEYPQPTHLISSDSERESPKNLKSLETSQNFSQTFHKDTQLDSNLDWTDSPTTWLQRDIQVIDSNPRGSPSLLIRDSPLQKKLINLRRLETKGDSDPCTSVERASTKLHYDRYLPNISITFSQGDDLDHCDDAVPKLQSDFIATKEQLPPENKVNSRISVHVILPHSPRNVSPHSVQSFNQDLLQARLCHELFDRMMKYGEDLQTRNPTGENTQNEVHFMLYLEQMVGSQEFDLPAIKEIAHKILKKLNERREIIGMIKVGLVDPRSSNTKMQRH